MCLERSPLYLNLLRQVLNKHRNGFSPKQKRFNDSDIDLNLIKSRGNLVHKPQSSSKLFCYAIHSEKCTERELILKVLGVNKLDIKLAISTPLFETFCQKIHSFPPIQRIKNHKNIPY